MLLNIYIYIYVQETDHHLKGVKWVAYFSRERHVRGVAAIPLFSGDLWRQIEEKMLTPKGRCWSLNRAHWNKMKHCTTSSFDRQAHFETWWGLNKKKGKKLKSLAEKMCACLRVRVWCVYVVAEMCVCACVRARVWCVCMKMVILIKMSSVYQIIWSCLLSLWTNHLLKRVKCVDTTRVN